MYGRIPEERKKHWRKAAAYYDDNCLPSRPAPIHSKPSASRREASSIRALPGGGAPSATDTRAAVGCRPAASLPPFLGKTAPRTEHALAANDVDSVTLAAQARERAAYSATQTRAAARLESSLGFSRDDSSLMELKEEQRHQPEHVKMLRKPPKWLKSKKQEALERIAKPQDEISLASMEAAYHKQPWDLDMLQENLLQGTSSAVRVSMTHVTDDQVLSLVETIDAVARLGVAPLEPAHAAQAALPPAHQPPPEADAETAKQARRREDGAVCVDVFGQYLSGIAGECLLTSAAALGGLEHLSMSQCVFPACSVAPLAEVPPPRPVLSHLLSLRRESK